MQAVERLLRSPLYVVFAASMLLAALWALGLQNILSLGSILTKQYSAFSFVLISSSLLIAQRFTSRRWHAAASFLALCALAIGLFRIQHAIHLDFGTEELVKLPIFSWLGGPATYGTSVSNSVCICTASIAALLFQAHRGSKLRQLLGGLELLVGFLTIVSFLYRVPALSDFSSQSPLNMALRIHLMTAAFHLLLGLSLMVVSPADVMRKILCSATKGLYLCKSVLQDHHGMISCQSEPTKGSIFTIRLPLSSRGSRKGEQLKQSPLSFQLANN